MAHDAGMGTLMASVITLRAGDREFRAEFTKEGILIDGTPAAVPQHAFSVADGDRRLVFLDGEVYEFELQRQGRRKATAHHSSLMAPMPATVIKINVEAGAAVRKGETLLVLEAMKMELPIRAAADGVVSAIHCRQGDLVQPGVPLVELDD